MSPGVNGSDASRADHQAACGTEEEPNFRVCDECKARKPLNQFAKDSWTRTGWRRKCQTCRTWYDREQDYLRRSKAYGHVPVVEDFTEADLVERHGEKCYYCPTGSFECIDHLICVRVGGTHTLDNVVPCCLKCNVLKRWTIDEPLIRAYRRTMESGGMSNGNRTQPSPEFRLPGAFPQHYADLQLELAAIVPLHPDVHPDRYVDTPQKTDVVRSA